MADLKEITERLEKGVDEFFTTEKFKEYLNVMGKFHNYSLNNQILIAGQNPNATYVAGFNSWIKNFGRRVKKGEKAIKILAPQKYKAYMPVTDKDGNEEIKEVERISFRPVNVFDIRQTEGKELPSPVEELREDVSGYEKMLEAVRQAAPYRINIMEITGSAKGWCDHVSETIAIKQGMGELQTVKTAVHETAHARLHKDSEKLRSEKEVEAEGCAYVVLSHFGLDTSEYSFGYVASWSAGKTKDELKESMKTIHDESAKIIGIMEDYLKDGTKSMERLSYKKKAEETVRLALADTDAGYGTVKGAYVYDVRDTKKAQAYVCYEGNISERELNGYINENAETDMDIIPIKTGGREETYGPVIQSDMEDDRWPMVTVTYSSEPAVAAGESMNIYKAADIINGADARLTADGIRGRYLMVNVAYTYMGRHEERTATVILGEARNNFIDYLPLSSEEITYMKRHVQLLDTVYDARSKVTSGRVADMYNDRVLEWAEKGRRSLNYMGKNPVIKKPPELNDNVKIYEGWEMTR